MCRPSPRPATADAERLHEAVGGLLSRSPELSAATGLWRWQRRALAGLAGRRVRRGRCWRRRATLVGAPGHHGGPVPVRRDAALGRAVAPPCPHRHQSPSTAASRSPATTALPALYRARAAVSRGRRGRRSCCPRCAAIDYPADRLEVMLIVESVDGETQAALRRRRARLRTCASSSCPTGSRAPSRAPPVRAAVRARRLRRRLRCRGCARARPAAPRARRHARRPGRLGCLQAQLNIYNSNAQAG